jgi:hypothetical protein
LVTGAVDENSNRSTSNSGLDPVTALSSRPSTSASYISGLDLFVGLSMILFFVLTTVRAKSANVTPRPGSSARSASEVQAIAGSLPLFIVVFLFI